MQKVKVIVKRVLTFALVLVMVLSYAPGLVFAEDSMSEEFKLILNEDGKFEMYSVVPESEDDVLNFFMESEKMWDEYPDLSFDEFSEDYMSCVITNWEIDESHRVDIEYIYNKDTIAVVDEIIKKIPLGEYDEEFDQYDPYLFEVKDMELINYWVNNGDINDLISYSGEFKELLGYKNFKIDCRRGEDAPFYTMAEGFAPFMNDGSVYDVVNIGVKAKHVIYVPDETGDTPEELQAAVLKRIEEYIGKDKVEIVGYDQNPLDIMLSGYDESIVYAEEKVVEAEGYVAEYEGYIAECETNYDSDPDYYGMLIEQYQGNLDNANYSLQMAEEWLENAKNAKQEYIGEYNTVGGENYYLNEAVGDYYFTMAVGGEEYSFVVVKDSERMITPVYKSSDVKTGITVDSTDSSIPLDTLICVEELTSGTTYEDIMAVLNVKDGKSFDINLFSGSLDKYITKLANGEFKVRIPIGAEFDGKDLIVYYVDENKEIHEYEVTLDGKYAVFTTDHFSVYTLAVAEAVEDTADTNDTDDTDNTEEVVTSVTTDATTSPDTGDSTNIWFLYVMIGMSALAICYVRVNKRSTI